MQYLTDFIFQSNEEMLMTNEDIAGRSLRKAEMIGQREELDYMYEMSVNSVGQEFQLYLKWQEVQQASGQTSSKFILHEYEQNKAYSFFNEIVSQIRGLVCEEEDKLTLIEEKQEYVM